MRLMRKQAGLTLVELMVATTLSLVLLSGVLLVFSANKVTYKMQNGLGTLQENGRYAVRQIAADLQQTGFGGCQSPHLKPRIINVASPSAATAYLDDFAQGEFYDGRNNQSTSVTYGGVTMVLGTDSIEVRGALRSNINYVTGPVLSTGTIEVRGTASGLAANEYLLVGDCRGATIFRATSVGTSGGNTQITHTTGNTGIALADKYGVDAQVMEFATHTYFIGETNRTTPDGFAVTALYRFDGNSSVELVDGIEDMQIEYVLDTDNDGVVDTFRDASGITDWSEPVAVRIALLLNSVEGASSVVAPYTYFPSGSTAITPVTGDLRLRQEFSSLISVRNAVF